jgi:thiazole synthase ThiGH ThiG subunit
VTATVDPLRDEPLRDVPLRVGGRTFTSRLFLGTGKYPSHG